MDHKDNPLDAWQVVLMRPVEQIEPLANMLKQMGVVTLLLPTIAIAPLSLSAEQLQTATSAILQADWIIASSQNAVRCAPPAVLEALMATTAKVVTMGQATTRALKAKGVSVFFTPLPGTDSEKLLTESFLQKQEIDGKHIVLLAGVGGRTVLADTLTSRQAFVAWVKVYRQEKPTLALAPLFAEWSLRQKPFCFMATSENCLRHLLESVSGAQLTWLQRQIFIVASDRIAQLAKKWEIQHIFVANGAEETQLCATLLRVVQFCHTIT